MAPGLKPKKWLILAILTILGQFGAKTASDQKSTFSQKYDIETPLEPLFRACWDQTHTWMTRHIWRDLYKGDRLISGDQTTG